MKRVLTLFLIFIICFFVGCSGNAKNVEKSIDFLKSIRSYTADVEIEVKNDKQTLNYTGKQYYDKTKGYRFELNGERVLIYKDDKIYVTDLKNSSGYITDKGFDGVYKLTFIEEYVKLLYTNEKIKNSFKKIGENEYIVINLLIPGDNKNISKADLFLNVSNDKPETLIIYDSNNKEKIKVSYKNFNFNDELKDDLFKTN